MVSSFALPGSGEKTVRFKSLAEAKIAAQKAHRRGLPAIPFGAGTNCAFVEPKLSAVFLRSNDRSLRVRYVKNKTLVTVGAGLPWDDLVKFAVRENLGGIECLSGIPGTCGAAPVQNIGAYGASLETVFRSVEVLDLKTMKVRRLSRKACGFAYRQSIFNGSEKGRFLIGSMTIELKPGKIAMPAYAELREALPGSPSLSMIRRAVLATRKRKLPDWKRTPNCGSFFKNPIVAGSIAKKVLARHPLVPHWPESDGRTKFSAAWLIDHSGIRSKHWGKITISSQHALVLVNNGETKHQYLIQAISKITATVHKKFDVKLETEPNLLDKSFVQAFAAKQICISPIQDL